MRSSPKQFVEKHLTEIVHGPIRCLNEAQVIIQKIAGGSLSGHRPLSKVNEAALAEACGEIRLGLLRDWVAQDRDWVRAPLVELLKLELRDSISPYGWLRRWAEVRKLLDPAREWIRVADEVLPNPFRILLTASPAADRGMSYLTGPSHGDLHVDNILIPHTDGEPAAEAFRLIDLAEFEPQAPLSRDIATLAVSLIARRAGQLDPPDQDKLLRYVVSDAPTSDAPFSIGARTEPELTEIVRALWSPRGTFISEGGWEDTWTDQVRVSCLAQALLHATYHSVGQDGRWWCFRLAAQLAHKLLPDQAPDSRQARQLSPEICAEVPTTESAGPLAPRYVQRRNSQFVDRGEQRGQLRAALQDDVTHVIMVTGPTGVGKSELVEEVLTELGWNNEEAIDRRVRRYDAGDGTRLDMRAFLNAIEDGAPSNLYVSGSAYRARMQMALDTYTGTPLVIIVESGESLLDDLQTLRDPDLDETLEMLSLPLRSRVKVVLISQQVPREDGAVTWPAIAHPIPLSGLAGPDFRRFLENLDQAAECGLATLAPIQFARVHSRLRGNPRLAELLHALIDVADGDLGAQDVPAWLAAMTEEEVPQKLTDELISGLPAGQQRVIEALAAFGTPVDESAVVALLEPKLTVKRVRESLDKLRRRRIVRKVSEGRYRLPRSDIDRALAHLPSGDPLAKTAAGLTRRNLLHRAANVLDTHKKDDDDVERASDLYAHFAELDVLLRAGMYDEAHEAILTIDLLLRRWNQGALLREQREAVRGMLDSAHAEMENHAALGSVYSSLGLFDHANDSYRTALSRARSCHALESLRKIYINMGQMYKERNDLSDAHDHFANGLAIAQEDGNEADADRMAALEGLADCARASGRFSEALRLGNEALAIAEPADSPRTVDIALKLTRWLADVDRMHEAHAMFARAQASVGHDDRSVRARRLDCEADLRFRSSSASSRASADDYLDEAERRAQQAVDLALEQRDQVILRQARTTLCAIHLRRGDLVAARGEIEMAARHRHQGQSLLVVALRGLVAWRGGEPGKAADVFRQLRQEAQNRVDAGRQDFAAADMLGLALCAGALADGTSFDPAVEAFRAARRASEPAPGLARQLRFLIEQLDRDGQRSDLLRPVFESIA